MGALWDTPVDAHYQSGAAPTLTEEDRLLLTTSITLHGFALYRAPKAKHKYGLVGRLIECKNGQCLYEYIDKWATGQIADCVSRMGWSHRWVPLAWDVLPDAELMAFHEVVVTR